MFHLLIGFACLVLYLVFAGVMIYDARRREEMTPKLARRIILWPLVMCHYVGKKVWSGIVELASVVALCFHKLPQPEPVSESDRGKLNKRIVLHSSTAPFHNSVWSSVGYVNHSPVMEGGDLIHPVETLFTVMDIGAVRETRFVMWDGDVFRAQLFDADSKEGYIIIHCTKKEKDT